MKISIVTATYNSAATIRDTIESVLMQDYQDIEYLVIDGGSKDNTIDIVKEYEPKFNGRMRWVSERDKGLYDAINKGIRMATGDVVGIVNSDDFFHRHDVIKTIVSHFVGENIDAIYGDARVVKEKDDKKNCRYTWAKPFRPWMFKIGLMPPHPSFYARKTLFEKYGYYRDDFKIAADYDLMTRFMYKFGIKTKYIGMPILTMRDGGMSTSMANKARLNEEVMTAMKSNGLTASKWMLYLKYPFRIWEFFWFKNRK